MERLHKYPRTRHLQGSRLQEGDHDLKAVGWAEVRGRHLVIEEKIDGANSAVSFSGAGALRLQSRGHYLTGGPRERHFALLKTWATIHQRALHEVLGSRYVMYGEWVYAKHTIFYDRLPHYFLEFDLLDRQTGDFLSTPARRRLLDGLPVVSVPVVATEPASTEARMKDLIRPALYKSSTWRDRLATVAEAEGLDVDRVRRQTDSHDLAEGLYAKWEDEERVLGRYKYIRRSFLQSVQDSDGHWLSRPIVPNQLAEGVDIHAAEL
jgi:hypothetical protein